MSAQQLSFLLAVVSVVIGYYAVSASSGKCEDTWTYFEETGKCYKLFKNYVLWTQAAFDCRYEMGNVASIHSNAQNEFHRELGRGEDAIWTGFAIFNGKYREWSDLTTTDYTNWADGTTTQPPYDHYQMCTKQSISTGKWEISCCKKIAAYICQKDATVAPVVANPVTAADATEAPITAASITVAA